MNVVATALQAGYAASDILKEFKKVNPELAKRIDTALSQGYSEEEVVDFLSKEGLKKNVPFSQRLAGPKGMTESERRLALSKEGPKFSPIAKTLGGAALAAAPFLVPQLRAPGVAGAIGNYISQKIGSPIGPSASSPAAPMPESATSGTFSGAPIPREPPPPSGGGTPMTTIGALGSSAASALTQVAPSIMKIFGITDKKAVEAVTKIAELTGKSPEEIKQEITQQIGKASKEKIESAVKQKLEDLTKPSKGSQIGDAKTEKELASDLKSAVIRKTTYDPKKKKLTVVFNNDATYEYDDVPEQVFSELHKGQRAAKTKGKNEYGVWWVGKNPSLGAAFNQLIKEGGYNYRKIGMTPISEEDEEHLQEAYARREKSAKRIQETESTKEATRGILDKIPALKKEEPKQRALGIIELLNNYEEMKASKLKLLEASKGKPKAAATKKISVMDKAIVDKLLSLLPRQIAKQARDMLQNVEAADVIEFIRKHLAGAHVKS